VLYGLLLLVSRQPGKAGRLTSVASVRDCDDKRRVAHRAIDPAS
jgi:hypothetical protein